MENIKKENKESSGQKLQSTKSHSKPPTSHTQYWKHNTLPLYKHHKEPVTYPIDKTLSSYSHRHDDSETHNLNT